MASFRCYDNSDVIATRIITDFHLYLIQLWCQFFQIFAHGNVVYAQTWEVLTLKTISSHLKALYHWQGVAFTGSFLCKYAKHFKGVGSLRRHIFPVCNQVIQTSFAFVVMVNHWIINRFIIRNGWPSVIMFASWA